MIRAINLALVRVVSPMKRQLVEGVGGGIVINIHDSPGECRGFEYFDIIRSQGQGSQFAGPSTKYSVMHSFSIDISFFTELGCSTEIGLMFDTITIVYQ